MNWPSNKYTIWYMAIIENGRIRHLNDYIERHHIIPRSLGGNDTSNNIVKLTAREHFVCHRLLAKIFPNGSKERRSMNFALHKMAYGTNTEKYKLKSSQYEHIRKLNAQATREQQLKRFENPETKARQVEMALAASQIAAERNRNNPDFNKAQSIRTKERVEDGTHNFLGGEIQRNMWKDPDYIENQRAIMERRISTGAHPFQKSEFIELNKNKLRARWASMTPEERKSRGKAISEGKKRAYKSIDVACICVQCDFKFWVLPSKAKIRKFCSVSCATGYNKAKRKSN